MTTAAADYATCTVTALVQSLSQHEVSAAEITETAIRRIEAMDGPINAVVVRDFTRAREAARAADEALAKGERKPLLGVPMTVKESYNVAGLPTTFGFEEHRAWRADSDSVAAARLKAAGAIIIGKTNVPPALADWQSANPHYGRTNNPHDLSRSPGGSSGGSAAALAAGFTPLELGSDIGGSIRIPAAFCGVYGHKPTYGIIPLRGHAFPGTDGAPTHLSVGGPLARTAADLALALSVLAGPDEFEAVGYRLELPQARHMNLADYRVLILDRHPLAAVDGEILAALDRLGEQLANTGATVARESALIPDLADAHRTYVRLMTTAISRANPQWEPISAHEWMDALDAQLAVRRQWAKLFELFDVVVSPTLGVPAFPHDDEPAWQKRVLELDGAPSKFGAQLAWPGMAILANLPATAFPAGFTRGGLPIGLQAMGGYLQDLTTIGFAGLVEREFGSQVKVVDP